MYFEEFINYFRSGQTCRVAAVHAAASRQHTHDTSNDDDFDGLAKGYMIVIGHLLRIRTGEKVKNPCIQCCLTVF